MILKTPQRNLTSKTKFNGISRQISLNPVRAETLVKKPRQMGSLIR